MREGRRPLRLHDPLWCHGLMQFNHDNMSGVRLAEELVNRLDGGAWDPSSLNGLLERFHYRDPGLDAADAEALREWAGRLRAVFGAADDATRCAAANDLLDRGVRRVFLTAHDGMAPHMHFANPDAAVVGRLRGMTAGGVAVFIAEAGGTRLGACARRGCPRVFADTSRNGRRAYCSARCGNHDAVLRYRERQRGDDGGAG